MTSEEFRRIGHATGEVFLTHAKLGGRYVIRFSFGQTQSTWDTLERVYTLIDETVVAAPFTDPG